MFVVLRFLGLGLCVFAALWTVSEATAPVFPVWRQRLELLRQDAPEIEGVTIGNSHNRAIDFEALGLRGLHLWRAAGDVFESRYTLEQALPRLPRASVVFVSVSFTFLSTDNSLPIRNNRFAVRMEVYSGWRPSTWMEGDLPLVVGAAVAPIVRPDHWSGVVRSLIWGSERHGLRQDGSFEESTWTPLTQEALAGHGRSTAARHRRTAEEMTRHDPGLPTRAAAALEDLVRLAESHGVRVVLYTPPYFRTFGSTFDAAEKTGLRSVARRLDHEYCSTVYLDYSEHPGFIDSPELFLNGDHLSPGGARVFSSELHRRLMTADWCAGA